MDPEQERRNQILRDLLRGPALPSWFNDFKEDVMMLAVAIAFAALVVLIGITAIIRF